MRRIICTAAALFFTAVLGTAPADAKIKGKIGINPPPAQSCGPISRPQFPAKATPCKVCQ